MKAIKTQTDRLLLISIIFIPILGCAALVLAKPSFAAGVLAGGIVASANLYALIRLGKGLVRLAKGEEGNKLFFALKFAGKYGLVFAIISALIFAARLSPVAIAIGISNVPLAVALEITLPPIVEKSEQKE